MRTSGRAAPVGLALALVATGGCSLFATPQPPSISAASLAPAGGIGYVVCPNAVTPVELRTRTAEAPIRLPVSGTPALGDFAITTSPDGRWAYVVTSSVVGGTPTAGTGTSASSTPQNSPSTGPRIENVVVPIDLTGQRALAPIVIPGQGATHAIAVMPNGRTILAASGTTVVPVDAVTHDVGTPLDLGSGHVVDGLALNPANPMAYALVDGGVIPFDTANAMAEPEITTNLTVSSVYSPHGVVVSADGSTVYVVGQLNGQNFGGRVVPITAGSAALQPATSFDRFGVTDPAALAITQAGSSLAVVDAANDWVVPIALSSFADPGPPVRIVTPASSGQGREVGHPTDVVSGPGTTGVFIVAGFDSVVPYSATSRSFGHAIPVCSGASSMTVAAAP